MINNDWERFGDEIRRTIQDAVDNRDFSRLNQTVSDTIGRAMDNVSRGMRNGGWYRENPLQKGRADQPGGNMNGGYGAGAPRGGFNPDPRRAAEEQRMQRQTARPAKKLLYLKGTSTKIGGIFLAVTGYIFTVGTIIFLLLLALGAAATGWDLALQIGMGIFGLFGLAFINEYGMFRRPIPEICEHYKRQRILRCKRACTKNRALCKSSFEGPEKDDQKGLVLSGTPG